MNTLMAKKVHMIGKFAPGGERVGVTVLEVLPMTVSDLRTQEKHGYSAVRYKIFDTRYKNRFLYREVRTKETPELGSKLKVEEVLKPGDKVKVTGTTKGRGFAGVVKRHGFAGGPKTHGQSDRERAPGSSGSGTTPGRVYKGKRRAGRMGNAKVTVSGLKVLEVDPEKKLVYVIGSIPGASSGLVTVTRL